MTKVGEMWVNNKELLETETLEKLIFPGKHQCYFFWDYCLFDKDAGSTDESLYRFLWSFSLVPNIVGFLV